MLSDEYQSMKELARQCGSTQKQMGLALAKLNLWIVGGCPTRKADAEGYVRYRTYPHRPDIGDRSLPIWHKEKTLAALATIGIFPLPRFTAPPPVPKPRAAKASYMDKHGD
jgi:hypothetical protein